MDLGWPPWLALSVSAISLVGAVITAVAGPMIVERRKAGRATPEPLDDAVIAHLVDDAVALIQSAIADLQSRVGRLELMQMTDAHDRRG
ncbi:MAG TPA: hypothetical protein VIY28_14850 [Pseudonocardiaceae bacterium]